MVVGLVALAGCVACQAHRRDYDSMTPEQRTVHLEASIDIEAPLPIVAKFMADPCNEFLWQPWLREAVMTPPSDGAGTRRYYVNRFAGKDIVNEYVTVTFDDTGLTYETTAAADVQATGGTSFRSLAQSNTRVTLSFDPQALGFYWYMSDQQTTRVYRRSLAARLEDLKKSIEAGNYEMQLRDEGVTRQVSEASITCRKSKTSR